MPAAIANGESGNSARTKINEGFVDITHGGPDNALLKANGIDATLQSSGIIVDDSDNMTGIASASFNGSGSGATILQASATASGTLTMPALTGTIATGTGTTNKLAFWSATNILTAETNITLGGAATFAITGNLTVSTTLAVSTTSTLAGNTAIGTITGAAADGTLHVHTGTAGVVTAVAAANDLIVENSDNAGISILSPDDKFSSLYFGSPTDSLGLFIDWKFSTTAARMMTSTAGGTLTLGSGNQVVAITIDGSQKVGFGIALPTGKVHIDQADSSGAIPVLRLDQADIDDTFIDFIGTSAADSSRSISSSTAEAAAKFGAYRVEINGVTKWVRVYDSAV